MKKIFLTIFDLIFPRRKNDAAIADISPEDFYGKIPRWHGEIYPNMRAIFHYQNPTAKAMIKELKSSKNRHAAQIAAHALVNFFQENGIRDAIIVPMPISKKRREKRGYNQCEFIAKFFTLEILAREKVTGNPVIPAKAGIQGQTPDSRSNTLDSVGMIEHNHLLGGNDKKSSGTKIISNKEKQETHFEIRTDILEKPVDTAKLAFENRADRLRANEGVFRALCTLSHLKNRIIIIDDVITTGSTMREAIETLRGAGAKDVSGVGIAH